MTRGCLGDFCFTTLPIGYAGSPSFSRIFEAASILFERNGEHHPDSEIEGAAQIIFRDVADFLQQVEDGLLRPRAKLNFGNATLRKDTRKIVGQAATGDVGRALQKFLRM